MKTKIQLIAFLLCLLVMGAVVAGNAQSSVKQTSDGNYVSVSVKDTAASYRDTGKHYTDSRGNQYPVYISARGKLFVIYISKNSGKSYRVYLKTN